MRWGLSPSRSYLSREYCPLVPCAGQAGKKLKVPSLVLPGDIVDLRLFNHADALRKAEVFEEIMENYRSIRKEGGLGW